MTMHGKAFTDAGSSAELRTSILEPNPLLAPEKRNPTSHYNGIPMSPEGDTRHPSSNRVVKCGSHIADYHLLP